MEKLAENFWFHNHMARFDDGRKLPLRLTVAKLQDGMLWLHALTPLSDELKESLSELGTVGYLYCGNNLHHMWFMEWVDAYPDAEVWITPGIPEKLPELQTYRVFQENPWPDDFETVSMQGVPFFDETAFLHKNSQSLIVTDMVQNHIRKGVYIAPPLLKEGVIKDQAAFKDFVRQISDWDFQRIVITHGANVEESAKEEFLRICESFGNK